MPSLAPQRYRSYTVSFACSICFLWSTTYNKTPKYFWLLYRITGVNKRTLWKWSEVLLFVHVCLFTQCCVVVVLFLLLLFIINKAFYHKMTYSNHSFGYRKTVWKLSGYPSFIASTLLSHVLMGLSVISVSPRWMSPLMSLANPIKHFQPVFLTAGHGSR